MEKWKMYRLGFRNFWLYDKEDFLIPEGHLLLRGSNASGKSITTQSFIPFILDGNRSPERLDPFGSRDRKMDYYLLGDGEKEESTGYLFLEFKKQDLEVYTTIGVGLRAQRGKGLDFWGFCLCDGRRIGENDFELYEKLGKQMLPLSKQKLKNKLADPENWAETPGAYKKLVNDRLYGFRDLRQFDQMVQLLIKVRAPKLSKDAFRPEEVKKILNDALQVLTDDDLSAMVSTMERMDELTATLQSSRAARQSAGYIRTEYNRYNQCILGKKGKAYLDARERSRAKQAQLTQQENTQQAQQEALEAQRAAQEKAKETLLQVKAQREAMGEDDLAQKQERLEALKQTAMQQGNRLEDDQNSLKRVEDTISRREVQRRTHREELQNQEQAVEADRKELAAVNQLLQLETHGDAAISSEYIAPLRAALKTRKEFITRGQKAIEQRDYAGGQLDFYAQALEEANRKQTLLEARAQEAQTQEREERDRLIEDFARWQSGSQELVLDEADTALLQQSLSRYRVPSDWTVIQQRLNEQYQQSSIRLEKQFLDCGLKKDALTEKIQKTTYELNQIQNQPEPNPPRREQTEALRIQLTMRGIPHSAFYEAVDFAPQLSQSERDRLEAQLMDAGLLDALLVPQDCRGELEPLLEEYPDRFLLPGEKVDDPITSLLPIPGGFAEKEVQQCLSAISQSDLSAQTALLPDGRFRSGMVTGRSHGFEPAGYVGAAARKANRQRKIDELTRTLAEQEKALRKLEQEVQKNGARRAALEEEWQNCPGSKDLDAAIETLNDANRNLNGAQADAQAKNVQYQQAKQEYDRLETWCREQCRGLPYARTRDGYREAMDAWSDYSEVLNRLEQKLQMHQSIQRRYEELEEELEQDNDQWADRRRAVNLSRQELEKTKAVIQELQTFLDRPENAERARRIRELEAERQRQENAERTAAGECIRLSTTLQNLAQRIRELSEEAQTLSKEAGLREDYFREELALGLVEKMSGQENADLGTLASQAFGLIQPNDRERSAEQLGETLRGNLQRNNSTLLSFHPKLAPIFESAADGVLRQRLLLTMLKDGKEMSLYQFMDSLDADITLTESVLEENDRRLFENILLETISQKLRSRIRDSENWCSEMSRRMSALDTSMGMRFSLDWKPKKAENPQELDTEKLVNLLKKDQALLTQQDREMVSRHFRSRVQSARSLAVESDGNANYADLIRLVLDYRTWFEFRLFFQRDGEQKKELTNRVFSKFSGGEKAMAMYVPLFAAVSAQYQKANETCPKMIALDEAFAGVDDRNISAMFALVGDLGFDYIMNSQALWGCYPNVRDLNIVELLRPANASFVTLLRYHWNGSVRQLEDSDV